MKRRDWKKTAAFVTSVAMATSMMPAELGAVLVHAADTAIVVKNNNSSLSENTFEVGDYFEGDVEFKKPSTDEKTYKVSIVNGATTTIYDAVTAIKYEAAAEKIEEGNAKKYIPKIKIECATVKVNNGDANVATDENTVIWLEGQSLTVNDVDGTSISFAQRSAVSTYQLKYLAARKYISKISYTNKEGKSVSLNADAVSSGNTADVKAWNTVTIESKVLLDGTINVTGKKLSDYMTGEPGKYVYTFNALDNVDLIPVKEMFTTTDEDTPKTNGVVESLSTEYDDEYTITSVAAVGTLGDQNYKPAYQKIENVEVGTEVTIVSPVKFEIKDGAIKSIKANGEIETEDVSSTYADHKWSATFYLAPFAENENPTIAFKYHKHDLKYANNGSNELLATCDDGDLNSETAAKVWAEINTNTKDDKGKYIFDEIANNGSAEFNDDVNLIFKWDSDLLGTSGTKMSADTDNNIIARVEIAKGEDVYTYTTYNLKSVKGNGENACIISKMTGTEVEVIYDDLHAKSANENNVPKVDLITSLENDKPNKYTNDVVISAAYLGGLSTGTLAFDKTLAAKAGAFDVKLTVWTTNAFKEAQVLNYHYDVNPSDQIKESDIKVYAAYTDKIRSKSVTVYTNEALEQVNVDNETLIYFDGYKYKTAEKYPYKKICNVENVAEYNYNINSIKSALEKANDDLDKKGNLTDTEIATLKNNIADLQEAYDNEVAALHNFIKTDKTYALEATKNANGVWEIPAEAENVSKFRNVTAIFEVEDSKAIALNAANKALNKANAGKDGWVELKKDYPETFILDTDYVLTGSSVSNVIDPANPHNMEVNIINPNFRNRAFDVNWKLVTPVAKDSVFFAGENVNLVNDVKGVKLEANKDNVDTVIKNALSKTGNVDFGADFSNVVFSYSINKPVGDFDIDNIKNGLPKITDDDCTNGTKFYVYAQVGDLKAENILEITATANAGNTKKTVIPALSETTFTYGDKIDDSAFTFSLNGKLLTGLTAENVKVKVYPFDAANKGYASEPLKDDGNIVNTIEQLVPGKYQIAISSAVLSDNVSYEIDHDDDDDTKDIETRINITINKKKLDLSMIDDQDLIKEMGSATSRYITNEDVSNAAHGVNGTNLKLRLTGQGVNTVSKPGSYQVEVTPTDDALPEDAYASGQTTPRYSDCYEGPVMINWYVVNRMSEVDFKLKKVNGSTNIYSDKNGVQLHYEAQMVLKDETYQGVDKYVRPADKTTKKATVTYGFVYDKTRTFAKDADANDVARALKISNGFNATNGTKKNTDGCVTGINSVVSSIDDYIWVRPYATVEGGAPVYGEPEMIDFETLAQEVVKPKLESIDLVQKKVNGESGLYYYVYATKNDRVDNTDNTNILRTVEPKKWGVVISRKDNYDALDKAATATAKSFDYEKLTLDNCDVSSAAVNTANYNQYEVGTLVRITDSLSRVYVRTYVDFGNGLVVYSKLPVAPDADASAYNTALEKVSKDSVSSILSAAGKFNITTSAHKVKDSNSDRLLMSVSKPNIADDTQYMPAATTRVTKAGKSQVFEPIKVSVKNTDDDKSNWFTEMGLVIDKTGAYNPETSNKQLVVGEGFTEVKKEGLLTEDAMTNINANGTNTTIDLNAITTPEGNTVTFRGYVVYKGVKIYTATHKVDNAAWTGLAGSNLPGYGTYSNP